MNDLDTLYEVMSESKKNQKLQIDANIKTKQDSSIQVKEKTTKVQKIDSPLGTIAKIISLITAAIILGYIIMFFCKKLLKYVEDQKEKKEKLEKLKRQIQVKLIRLKDEKEYWGLFKKKSRVLKEKRPEEYKKRMKKALDAESNIDKTMNELKQIGKELLKIAEKLNVSDKEIGTFRKQVSRTMDQYNAKGTSHILSIK